MLLGLGKGVTRKAYLCFDPATRLLCVAKQQKDGGKCNEIEQRAVDLVKIQQNDEERVLFARRWHETSIEIEGIVCPVSDFPGVTLRDIKMSTAIEAWVIFQVMGFHKFHG